MARSLINHILTVQIRRPLKKQKLPNWVFIFAKRLNSSIALWRGGNLNLTKTAFNMLLAKIKLDFRRFKDLNFKAIGGNKRFVHAHDFDR